MPQNQRAAQLQYCRLITSLVSDQAIARGIVSQRNVTPILFFFIQVGNHPVLRTWLMPTPSCFKESRCLQIVGWLMDQYVFCESKKSHMAEYLVEMGDVTCSQQIRNLQSVMSRPLPPDLSKILQETFELFF